MALGKVSSRIVAAIRAAAEAGSDQDKISLGDPEGARITLEGVGTYDRGKSWARDRTGTPGYLDFLLESIGAELDRATLAFGKITTNATGVTPTVVSHAGLTTATKHEASDRLTVNLSPSFDTDGYFIWSYVLGLAGLITKVHSQATSNFVVEFTNASTLLVNDINNLTVHVIAVGAQLT